MRAFFLKDKNPDSPAMQQVKDEIVLEHLDNDILLPV
jgi:hypothetical protein